MAEITSRHNLFRLNPNTDLIDKLVFVAIGDIDLVNEAIRAARGSLDEPADLEKVVNHIVQRRKFA